MRKIVFYTSVLASSILLMSSVDSGDIAETNSDRPMFGTRTTGWGPCEPTGRIQVDGTPVCNCPTEETTYVFWIGVSKKIVDHYGSCPASTGISPSIYN